MKKVLTILILYLIIFPSSVLADGGIWRYYQDRWEPLSENEQKAAINYQDGLEKMIIDVNFNMEANDKAVWIFPVPAKPEKVVIDVVTNFPELYGNDPRLEAKSSMNSMLFLSSMTQLYPIVIGLPFFFFGGVFSTLSATAGAAVTQTTGGVTVHEQIEKEGITTEIITAETGDALYNYLNNKGLNIERNAISIFDGYIGKDYSFVVSWVSTPQNVAINNPGYVPPYCSSDVDCSKACSDSCPSGVGGCCVNGNIGQCNLNIHTCYCDNNAAFCSSCPSCGSDYYCNGYSNTCIYSYVYQPSYYPYQPSKELGIFITFPTDKIYFPLLPTSIYGSTKIPINIFVLDHVEPQTYQDIKSYVKSDYYVSSYTSTLNLESFYGNIDTRNMKYTKIQILDAPSKYFTDDLWFNKGAPLNVGFASLIYSALSEQPLISGIVIILLISALTGALAGFLVFKNWKKYALIGLTNIFSIIGLAIALIISRSDKKISEDLKKRMKDEGVSAFDRRKYIFIPVFSLLFLGICFLLFVIFNLAF